METRANYVFVGSCVLAAIISIVIFVFWLTRNALNKEADIYYTYFSGSVAGLPEGGSVRYRGVPVGTVGQIEIDPENIEKIRVTLKLKPQTPVKIDTVASLESSGITGGSYVELSGGTQTGQPLVGQDDNIPVIRSETSGLQSALADAPKLLGKLNELADRANRVLSDGNVKDISDTLDSLKDTTAKFDEMTPDAKAAVASVNKILADLRTQLPQLTDQLKQDGESIKGAADEFHAVAKNIDAVITENRAPLRDFAGNGLTQASALIAELRTLTSTLNRVADRLDRDPQRYLFGGDSNGGIDPAQPLRSGASRGVAK